jgi:hypothetical protein
VSDKLTARQKAQLMVLETLPARFQQIHRLIEEIAGMRVDETVVRRLTRLLDESKAATNTVGLTALTETMGVMGMLARRTGGHQMKIRGLREGMGSLKINFEGAMRSATTAQEEKPGGPGGAAPA